MASDNIAYRIICALNPLYHGKVAVSGGDLPLLTLPVSNEILIAQ